MFHNNHIKNLLNIKEKNFKINKVVEEEFNGVKNKVIYATFSKKKCSCSNCNSKNTIKYGFKNINIKFLKSSEFYTRIKIKKQRYFCKDCNKTFSQNLSFVSEKSNIAKPVRIAVKLALKDSRTEKNIAKEYNISPSTVSRILAKEYSYYKPYFDSLPKKLCFDEFKSTKDIKGAMSFVYCNAENSKIIDIVEDRKLKSLQEYFAHFSLKARNSVENIVIDMYSPYMVLIKKIFPNAKISIDRFHLSQLISRSFNQFRVKIMNKIKYKNRRLYNKIKRYWKLLLKNSCELLTEKIKRNKMFDWKYLSEEDIVNTILKSNEELKKMYDIYQEIIIAIKDKKFKKFKEIIEENYDKIEDKKIKTTFKTYIKYLEFIENSLTLEYSNGRIEGLNRKIKVLKHTAYGYKKFNNFRNRILIMSNLIA